MFRNGPSDRTLSFVHGRDVFHRIPPPIPSVLQNTAFADNPLVASVLRENVRIQENRAIIPLWLHWPALVTEIPGFGRVLSIARNPHAVLGTIRSYPGVLAAPCGHCACGEDGTTEYHFASWSRASVSVEEQRSGWLYAVEFADHSGDVLHKICLTAGSDFEVFRSWVELHQGGPQKPAARFPDRMPHAGDASPSHPAGILLSPASVPAILQRLMDEKRTAQFVIGNEGFVQGADLLPHAIRQDGQWIFANDEECGLHLRTARIAEVRRQRVCWRDGASNLIIRLHEPEGRLICAVAPPRFSEAPAWDEFVTAATAPFAISDES